MSHLDDELEELEELEERHICYDCIGEDYIKGQIKENGAVNRCNYCKKTRECFSLKKLSEWVDKVYRRDYEPAPEYPISSDGSDPEYMIAELLDVDDNNIAKDILAILSDNERDEVQDGGTPYYDDTIKYVETPIHDYEYSSLWDEFCKIVKHHTRFFSEESISILEPIFDGIDKLKYSGDTAPIRQIKLDDKERYIYRARKASEPYERIKFCLDPSRELGPPPPDKTPASRMNSAGIPVFYGAFDRPTCIAELRLPVGDVAVSAEFEIIKPLLILDLTVFDQIYHELSPFDPRFESECSRLKFLHRFEKEISKPILPEGEHLEYIPTQAFAEYLASHYKPRIDGVIYKSRIDGIIFSSPQTGGKGRNIVLLNHVAVVAAESNQSNEQDRFSKYRETWRDGDYSISELTQSPKVHKGRILLLIEDPPYGIPYSSKSNIDPSVKLVPNRLQVHRVMVKNEPQTEEQTLTFHIQTDTVHVQQKEKDGDL